MSQFLISGIILGSTFIIQLMGSSSPNYNSWISSSPLLPYKATQMAVGYDMQQNRILLIGGINTQTNIISYSIDNNTFNTSSSILSHKAWGNRYYTQIDNILYIIDETELKFNTLNLNTLEFTYYYNSIDIPGYAGNIHGGANGCLASLKIDNNNQYLFVLGGYSATFPTSLHNVLILNLSSNSWLTNISQLQQGRSSLACITHNDQLYAIGGGEVKTIEKLFIANNLINIEYEEWQYIDNLICLEGIEGGRAIVYQDDILIIGGRDYNKSTWPWTDLFPTQINVINTLTNTVSIDGDLVYGTRFSSAIIVNNMGYTFGGDIYSPFLDTWQYIDLHPSPAPTIAPTTSPTDTTVNPTTAPSTSPTSAPSIAPTQPPSSFPSYSPTNYPSNAPSLSPTFSPIVVPSLSPTFVPSLSPIPSPSVSPSKYPTLPYPTIGSTFTMSEPSNNPTIITDLTADVNEMHRNIVCCYILVVCVASWL